MSEVRTFTIPAPIDGMNLRDSPYALGPTEAVKLDNYLVFDWGIRETGALTSISQPHASAVGQIIYFKNNSGTPHQLVCVNNKIYDVTTVSWGGASDLTGALSVSSNAWRYCFFKNRIFMVNGTNAGLIYNIGAATLAADTWAGLTTDNASHVFSYKGRLYYIEKESTSVWYDDDVSTVTGTLLEEDVGDVLESYGTLLFGTSWSVNQGNQNETLFVLVSSSGEVLIYSGDSPAASNWALLARVQIPTPSGNQAFTRFGQDIIIRTHRGAVSLAAIVAGRTQSEAYYNLSRKLADQLGSSNIPPIQDPRRPFMYFSAGTAEYVYVLNYERGAWSRIVTGKTDSATITALSWYDNGTTGSFLNVSFSDGTSLYLDDTAANSVVHRWLTGFLPQDATKFKQVTKVRAFGRNILGSGNSFRNTVSAHFDTLYELTSAPSDSKVMTVNNGTYIDQELHPSGTGRRMRLNFARNSTSEQNEIAGVDVYYTLGGDE